MAAARRPVLSEYLDRLGGLPVVKAVTPGTPASRRIQPLWITTATGRHRVDADLRTSHLGLDAEREIVSHLGGPRGGTRLLCAPYVSPPMAERLVAGGVSFIDLAGNCHVRLGRRVVAHVTGRRPESSGVARPFRAPAYRLLFSLLADPSLVRASARVLAGTAGVSVGTVSNVLRRLRAERFVVNTRSGLMLVGTAALVERWSAAWADLLRPQLTLGRFEPPQPARTRLDQVVQEALQGGPEWAFGGGAAAYRLAKHYRGDETIVHTNSLPQAAIRSLRAVSSLSGSLVFIAPPSPKALVGPAPRVAHPLLVYAELLAAGHERAAEAAREIRERYLELP